MVAYHPYSLPVYMYVAFGSQGLPAMMPVLLPALAAAFAVLALCNLSVRPAPRRAAIAPASTFVKTRDATETMIAPGAGAEPVLTFRFERRLGSFELDVAWSTRARRLAILGPSGAGKTMTLRLIAGLDRADSGVLRLGEKDLWPLPAEARGVGYVPQDYALFPHMTVARQVLFPAGAKALAARRWLDRLGLSGLEERLPAALSIGQQQRVALVRALVRPVDIVLLDEPFSALDTPLRRRLREEFRKLEDEIQATVAIVTHDPDEAAALADEILVLDQGRVLQTGTTEMVFARPASETVARLLGAENVVFGTTVGESQIEIGKGVSLSVGGPPLVPNERVGWSVRPEYVRLSGNGRYEAAIEEVVSMGAMRQVSVRLGDVRLRLLADPSSISERCRLDIDPGSIQVWKA